MDFNSELRVHLERSFKILVAMRLRLGSNYINGGGTLASLSTAVRLYTSVLALALLRKRPQLHPEFAWILTSDRRVKVL